MTAWDVLNNIINGFPPVALALLLIAAVAAAVVFVVGFARHGVNFIKYGFKQTVLDSTLEKRFDDLESKLERIEVNHFGHLKNYLGVLNGILLGQGVIDNESKARLDNELRGM
jgi:hypothetical protein